MYCYVVNIIIMSIIMITRCGEYIIQLYLVVYSCMHYTSWLVKVFKDHLVLVLVLCGPLSQLWL